MDSLSQLITSDLSLWGLFISSFLAATLLPGGSEAVLFGILKLHPELYWPALMAGSLGNTLGGMVTFGMGWMIARLQHGGAEHSGTRGAASHLLPQTAGSASNVSQVQFQRGGAEHSGAGGTASHPPSQPGGVPDNASRGRTQQLKHVEKVRTYGSPILVLAWVPLVGDALCLAGGWLRLNWWQAALFMALGKFARYWVIAAATHY